jgi:hypothetical protein
MLIQCLPCGHDLDAPTAMSDQHWHASPHAKFERLLRETAVPIGLLYNSTQLRLIYAPRGETSGYMTFAVAEMVQVAGRPIFAALHMLLSAERLFSLPASQRLPAILAESRKYQSTVSTQLATQVLAALYELVRGFQAANDQQQGALLREVLGTNPNHVYAGLLTVLMRLVFLLYAEDRGLLSGDPIYTNCYAVTGLFERLREDASRYPDLMDLRYGAWAQLLTLFRLIYDGGSHGAMYIPAHKGYLFDPDRYPFLEGRPYRAQRPAGESYAIPRMADGVIFRVLDNLLMLDGERLSYRTLDVEHIGSVYETMMGFNLEVAQGQSMAIKPTKAHGAPRRSTWKRCWQQSRKTVLNGWLTRPTRSSPGRRQMPSSVPHRSKMRLPHSSARSPSTSPHMSYPPDRWSYSHQTNAAGVAHITHHARLRNPLCAPRCSPSWHSSVDSRHPSRFSNSRSVIRRWGAGHFSSRPAGF